MSYAQSWKDTEASCLRGEGRGWDVNSKGRLWGSWALVITMMLSQSGRVDDISMVTTLVPSTAFSAFQLHA